MKITKKYLQDLIKEELAALLKEGAGEMLAWKAKEAQKIKKTTLAESRELVKQVLRLFWDNNERHGITTALENAGLKELANTSAMIRSNIEKILYYIDAHSDARAPESDFGGGGDSGSR